MSKHLTGKPLDPHEGMFCCLCQESLSFLCYRHFSKYGFQGMWAWFITTSSFTGPFAFFGVRTGCERGGDHAITVTKGSCDVSDPVEVYISLDPHVLQSEEPPQRMPKQSRNYSGTRDAGREKLHTLWSSPFTWYIEFIPYVFKHMLRAI